jgi:osmoprotectant transport system permease protein
MLGTRVDSQQLQNRKLRVGSKAFTENAILGEMVGLLAERQGMSVEHTRELGTRNCWTALLTGEMDIYPEYTGTLREELFAGELLPDDEALRKKLAGYGIRMTSPLGFNNTYAIGMKEDLAEQLRIKRISDLIDHPELRFRFSNEFMDRADGWPSMRDEYGLMQKNVRGVEHALAYRALDTGAADVTDVYSTDSNIARYGLRVLEDDRAHFPRYDAAFIYREELAERAPDLVSSIEQISGTIDDHRMLTLNQAVELNHQRDTKVAADFLNETMSLNIEVEELTLFDRILTTTLEHLVLVVTSLIAAIVVALPLGIIAAKKPVLGQFIVGGAEIVQTIPGLALLIFMSVGFALVALPTLGAFPVIVALFLYSLLPIIRNTMTGLTDVPNSMQESAIALGLTPAARLRLVELPMASRMILAGIKTTAVINVGYAALGGAHWRGRLRPTDHDRAAAPEQRSVDAGGRFASCLARAVGEMGI